MDRTSRSLLSAALIALLPLAITPAASAAASPPSARVAAPHAAYHFGRASFVNFLWIKDGALFANTGKTVVDVEMIDGGAFSLEAYDATGRLVSTGTRDNVRGGWSSFDFTAGMIPPVPTGQYKLKLVNRAPGTRHVLQGDINPA